MLPVHALFAAGLPLAPERKEFAKNDLIYTAGAAGQAWRVVSGVVSLDRHMDDGLHFAGMAMPGDVIGIDACLTGQHSDTATALTPCTLAPWFAEEESSAQHHFLAWLATQEKRTAEVLSLRCGSVEERMRRFFALIQLAQHGSDALYLPSLRHISRILDVTVESASRVLSRWRSRGWLGARHQGQALLNFPHDLKLSVA